MELKDFVKTTLLSIADGVDEATEQRQKEKKEAIFQIQRRTIKEETDYINFDVAVTTSTEKSGAAEGSAKVFVVANIGAKGEVTHTTENVSRVKFQVHFGI